MVILRLIKHAKTKITIANFIYGVRFRFITYVLYKECQLIFLKTNMKYI